MITPAEGVGKTVRRFESLPVRQAQGMLGKMIRNNPRWQVYLPGRSIRQVKQVMGDDGGSAVVGGGMERTYKNGILIGVIFQTLRTVSRRQLRLFDHYNSEYYGRNGQTLRKVMLKLILGKIDLSSESIEGAVKAVGLNVLAYDKGAWPENKLPEEEKNRRNATALRYVHAHHFDVQTGRLKPESARLLAEQKLARPQDRTDWTLAIEELEFIFNNPRVIRGWAPGFPA